MIRVNHSSLDVTSDASVLQSPTRTYLLISLFSEMGRGQFNMSPFNPILPGLLNTLQTRGGIFYTPLQIRLFLS